MLGILNDFIVALTYPPMLSLCLLLCGATAAALRWRKTAVALSALGIGWSVLWSIPWCSERLRETLERRHAVLPEDALPLADAIVVLGGGSHRGWSDRDDVNPYDLKGSRLAAGARAWLAGRAPVIVLSGGGGGPRGSEAARMAAAIAKLGVPASALILETRSEDTGENARFTAALAERHGWDRVLLVTSSLHMPRASLLFRQSGLNVISAPVPERRVGSGWKERWLPTPRTLWRSGRAWKEYAGLLAINVQMTFRDVPDVTRQARKCERDDGS